MSIKIHIPSYLQPFTSEEAIVEVNGSTVYECLNDLVERCTDIGNKIFDKEGELLNYVSIYLDGEFIYADELDKPASDGDEFHLFYILGGG